MLESWKSSHRVSPLRVECQLHHRMLPVAEINVLVFNKITTSHDSALAILSVKNTHLT